MFAFAALNQSFLRSILVVLDRENRQREGHDRGPQRARFWLVGVDDFQSRRKLRNEFAALQFAEKLVFVLAFGWRSGLPLR